MKTTKMTGMLAIVLTWFLCAGVMANESNDIAPGRKMAKQAAKTKGLWITADHSGHEILKQEFTSGPEVTKACLSCHNQAALQFHKTIHWTWMDPATEDSAKLGKGGLSVNNFCINIQSNEKRCTSCHAGYGWKDKNFDFSDQTRVDCLICHEQTGTYKKFPAGAGNPVSEPKVFKGNKKTYHPPDWNKAAQSVGRPTRKNCGACHFFGGGGDGVKHGDMDSSLTKPNKALDVHMGTDSRNFDCVRCHSTKLHNIAGRVYTTPASKHRKSLLEDDLAAKITCESCHGNAPHKAGNKANDHTDKVACQSCHIPTFARVNPTKMWWDWSKAGNKKDGKPYVEKGELGKPVYMTKKGDMKWEKNVTPEYHWYNGSISQLTVKDTIDPAQTVRVNWPEGGMDDENSRIFPFKVHRGKQPYDKVNKNLVIPHLFGSKETDAYWKKYDWAKSIAYGMEYAGLDFSGEHDFVETSYVFPITHMVAPKENVVNCVECHVEKDGRLANLAGFYMPGRDSYKPVNIVGWALVFGCLAGVTLHGLGRIVANGRKKVADNGKDEDENKEG